MVMYFSYFHFLASTWENAVFNLTQAADIAGESSYLQLCANSTDHEFTSLLLDYPDVTGGPLPTSTSSTAAASSASSVSVGAIVGGVIGAIAIIIIGGLIVFWAMRRRRRQRAHTTPAGVSSYNDYQPVTMLGPSIRNLNPVHPSTFWNTSGSPGPISPRITPSVRSATSIAATSLLVSPISSGFSSHGQNMAQPLTDAADMISPFLAMSPTRQMDRSNTSPPTSKAAEALSERAMAASAQRGRLNPPPYSAASVEPGSSEGASTGAERTSKKKEKKRNGSLSGMTTYSGHSRTSTKESATAVPAGPPTEASQPRAATPGVVTVESLQSVESGGGVGGDGGGGSVVMHGRASVSDQRPPAV